jgi:hypothetical protein
VFCTLVFALFQNASAQWVNMPTTIRTPNGNVKINTPVYMPMYRNYYYQKPNRKHDYTIVYLNDSIQTVKAKINISDSVHCLQWGKKSSLATVKPSETKEIYRLDEIGEKLIGKPLDSCWIFLSDHGKINTYSITSEMEDPMIAYIQKGDTGAIVLLTEENLKEMVKDNEEALKLADKKKLLKAIEKYNEQ